MNRSLRRVVLALAIGALCALVVAACGEDSSDTSSAVDAKRLLADLHELVPAKLGTQLARAVRSADVELWSGADDKILRQLVMRTGASAASWRA